MVKQVVKVLAIAFVVVSYAYIFLRILFDI